MRIFAAMKKSNDLSILHMEKKEKFSVSGLGWRTIVMIDETIFNDVGEKYIEAASVALERLIAKKDIDLGPIVEVKSLKTNMSALVNSYICLNNIGRYSDASILRKNFMEFSGGQDLAVDEKGYGEL